MWTSEELQKATQGQWYQAPIHPIAGVSIDTRCLQPGDLYVALKGENHDGHDFIPQAFKAGASAIVTSKKQDHAGAQLVVPDTMQALQDMGHFARQRSQAKIVAITGSVGKTTTKALFAHVLQYIGCVAATQGNLNNQIGVPLSLARLKAEAAFGVFELGTNHPGEIRPLSQMVKPHAVLVTAVEKAHQAFFPTEQDILVEKMSIADGLCSSQGIVILPHDHRHFATMMKQVKGHPVITYGEHPESTVHLQQIKSNRGVIQLHVSIAGKQYHYDWYLLGDHNIQASLAMLALGHGWGLDQKVVCEALSYFRPIDGRGRRHWLPWQNGIITIVDEAYNANPASMQAALKNLVDQPIQAQGRRIAVLADMLELGTSEQDDHRALAPVLEQLKIDKIFACGPLMKTCYDQLQNSQQGGWAPNAEELWPLLRDQLNQGDVVLVKGSHSMKLDFILNQLFNHNKK